MSHLTLETIARLVDDEPVATEAAHLEACAACRAELDAMREDVHALSLLPDMAPAPDSWNALEQRLAEEGLIRRSRFAGLGMRHVSWAAAALVVFMAGTMAGRLSAPAPQQVAQAPTAGDPVVHTVAQQPGTSADDDPTADTPAASDRGTSRRDALASAEDAPDRAGADTEGERVAPAVPQTRRGPVTLASNNAFAAPRNMDEAAQLLRQTEELYLTALTRYAELATRADAGDPVARLAALQSIVMTTQAALAQAPADPVINGYHLTALAQRDATLRQVATSTNDRLY